MANQKVSGKKIIENRVTGVVKAFESFKTSLRNNREKISEKEFNTMMDYLSKRTARDFKDLRDIFYDTESEFKFNG